MLARVGAGGGGGKHVCLLGGLQIHVATGKNLKRGFRRGTEGDPAVRGHRESNTAESA